MNSAAHTPQALNQALLEALEYVAESGWGNRTPHVFGLVPSELLRGVASHVEDEQAPLTLVLQDIDPAVDIADYLPTVSWPKSVVGAVLCQEIRFRDSSNPHDQPQQARLACGVLRNGTEQSLLSVKSDGGATLRGGPDMAPEVVSSLHTGFSSEA